MMESASRSDLEAWANEANARAMNRGMDMWYIVKRMRRPGSGELIYGIERWDGERAHQAQELWRGKSRSEFHPTEAQAAAIHREVGKLIAEGVTQSEFNDFVKNGWLLKRAGLS